MITYLVRNASVNVGGADLNPYIHPVGDVLALARQIVADAYYREVDAVLDDLLAYVIKRELYRRRMARGRHTRSARWRAGTRATKRLARKAVK